MVDLSTKYLGLQLKNPLVASASPLSKKLDGIRALEDAGIGGIVMYSLFEEQIIRDRDAFDYVQEFGTYTMAEALNQFPDLSHYNVGPDQYLEHIRKAKEAVNVPIIGSLNGISTGGWLEFAHKIEEAGADALELNIYSIPTDVTIPGQEMEQSYLELVKDIRKQVHIPLAVKISPFITSLPHYASQLATAGVNGLVLFNRFYQPDMDIETLEITPTLKLSNSHELLLPLRWVALLYGRVKTDFALTTGVHTAQDAIKAIMAGASVAMMASELIAKGPQRVTEILGDMQRWMEQYEYTSVHKMLGSMSQRSVDNPAAFERANYMKVLISLDSRKD
jgi:dihydroorotate dehydrogenase (fumarate)